MGVELEQAELELEQAGLESEQVELELELEKDTSSGTTPHMEQTHHLVDTSRCKRSSCHQDNLQELGLGLESEQAELELEQAGLESEQVGLELELELEKDTSSRTTPCMQQTHHLLDTSRCKRSSCHQDNLRELGLGLESELVELELEQADLGLESEQVELELEQENRIRLVLALARPSQKLPNSKC